MISFAALDYGSYTPPDTLDYAKLAACGVRLHIIGLVGNRWALTHVMGAQKAGVEAEVYVIPATWDSSGARSVERALRQVRLVYPKGRVWLDCEPLPHAPAPRAAVVRAWLRSGRAYAEGAGYTVGLYSSRSAWQITGPDGAFDAECAALPKWDACYDGLPYSGYSGAWGGSNGPPLVNQYAGSVTFCGANVDLNWVEGERMMTDEQIKELIGNTLGTLAVQEKRIDFLSGELYKAVSDRGPEAKRELEYVAKAGGVRLP